MANIEVQQMENQVTQVSPDGKSMKGSFHKRVNNDLRKMSKYEFRELYNIRYEGF